MNKIRFLITMVMCLAWHITTYGQTPFDPTSPPDPGTPQLKHTLTLVATPSEGGTVSGGGTYVDGSRVNLYASAKTGYTFEAWSDAEGMVISTSSSYQYTTKAANETLYAHFRFTPSSPDEPSEPGTILYYRLTVEATQGCTVSGGGRYLANSRVSLSASLETGYEFVNWTNEDGDVVSTSRSFSYTKKAKNEVLTANCRFNPSAPSEPTDPILRHWVKATCSDGGTVSGNINDRILEGDTYYLYVNKNQGYEFLGWYLNGEQYTVLTSFTGTMGKENLNFEARFRFNPDSPAEPPMAAVNLYSFYLMTVNGKPGDIVEYPINLANEQIVRDVNIRLMFPAGMEVDPMDYVLSDNAVGYNVTIAEVQEEYAAIEEGAKVYDFSFIGGETSPATQPLITFKVKIPEDAPTGGNYQVKINQISMAMEDGTAVTARTRNGRIGVYKLGDSNGDDSVDIIDKRNIVNYAASKEVAEFIEEVSDVNADGIIDISDARGIITIIKSAQ